MKRLLLVVPLLVLISAVSATALSFATDEGVEPAFVHAIEEHLAYRLADRIHTETGIAAHLSDNYVLTLAAETRAWELALERDVDAAIALIDEVLYWDLGSLVGEPTSPYLSLPLREGFVIEGEKNPTKGAHYWVTDPSGVLLGTLVAAAVDIESESVVAVQRSGKALTPFSSVTKQRPVEVGLFGTIDLQSALSAEALMRYPLPIYPLSLLASLSAGGQGIGINVGLGGTLFASALFGTKGSVWRNLSFEGWAMTGVGYGESFILRADGRIGLTYRLKEWSISAMVGNQLVVSNKVVANRGLFFTLGTAYTIKQ